MGVKWCTVNYVLSRYTFISDKGLWRREWMIQNYVQQAIGDQMEKMWNWVRLSSFAHITHLFGLKHHHFGELEYSSKGVNKDESFINFFTFIPLLGCPIDIVYTHQGIACRILVWLLETRGIVLVTRGSSRSGQRLISLQVLHEHWHTQCHCQIGTVLACMTRGC